MLNNTKYTEYKSLLEKETQRKPVTQSNGRKRKPPFRITNCLNILGIDTELDKKLSELESKLDKKIIKFLDIWLAHDDYFQSELMSRSLFPMHQQTFLLKNLNSYVSL